MEKCWIATSIPVQRFAIQGSVSSAKLRRRCHVIAVRRRRQCYAEARGIHAGGHAIGHWIAGSISARRFATQNVGHASWSLSWWRSAIAGNTRSMTCSRNQGQVVWTRFRIVGTLWKWPFSAGTNRNQFVGLSTIFVMWKSSSIAAAMRMRG